MAALSPNKSKSTVFGITYGEWRWLKDIFPLFAKHLARHIRQMATLMQNCVVRCTHVETELRHRFSNFQPLFCTTNRCTMCSCVDLWMCVCSVRHSYLFYRNAMTVKGEFLVLVFFFNLLSIHLLIHACGGELDIDVTNNKFISLSLSV